MNFFPNKKDISSFFKTSKIASKSSAFVNLRVFRDSATTNERRDTFNNSFVSDKQFNKSGNRFPLWKVCLTGFRTYNHFVHESLIGARLAASIDAKSPSFIFKRSLGFPCSTICNFEIEMIRFWFQSMCRYKYS